VSTHSPAVSDARVDSIEPETRTLSVGWEDGQRSSFHAVWLRDNCSCAECSHPSGQRLLDTLEIPDDLSIASSRLLDGGDVEISWSPGGHVSHFSTTWLRAHDYSRTDRTAPRKITLWDASIAGSLPVATYAEVRSSGRALRSWLTAVDEYGFGVLHGVTPQPEEIFRVVDLFGYVRETNYGRLFNVRSVINPTNLAFTGLALGAHTDNPYRDPTPTLQLLHCLSSSASGGDSTLVDGFRVAEALRESAPEQFDLLTRYPLHFRFRDEDTELETEVPVISLNEHGDVAAVHFNNRSKMPVILPAPLMERYYAAYRTFGRMLGSPEYQITLRLAPGDLIIMDNTRVLHGRTGFEAAGSRHLQGCYADRDGLRSRLAVLDRSETARG
jgi:gamma-butyrobetaine dioxygenase